VAFQSTLERVPPPPRQFHIHGRACRVQSAELEAQPLFVLGLDPRLRAFAEKPFQALVFEGFDHGLVYRYEIHLSRLRKERAACRIRSFWPGTGPKCSRSRRGSSGGAAYRVPLLLRNSSSVEESVQQFVTAYLLMSGNISEDCGQCADSQRIVKRDGDVVLGRARSGEPQVTA